MVGCKTANVVHALHCTINGLFDGTDIREKCAGIRRNESYAERQQVELNVADNGRRQDEGENQKRRHRVQHDLVCAVR